MLVRKEEVEEDGRKDERDGIRRLGVTRLRTGVERVRRRRAARGVVDIGSRAGWTGVSVVG